MKIEIIEKKKDSLRFKMYNAKHTIPNLLKNQLLLNKDVKMAAYDIDHFEEKDSTFFIKVKEGKNPNEIIKNAIEELTKMLKEFDTKAREQLPKEPKTKK
jgi:DNA-directed RNA polymerase subunit L